MLVIKKSTVLLPLIILPVFGSSNDSTFIKSPKTAFIASAIPGGGQIYNGKLIKGLAIMTLEVMALQLWRENSDIYSGYDSGDYRLAKGRYLEKRNKYAWWVVFLYFYSIPRNLCSKSYNLSRLSIRKNLLLFELKVPHQSAFLGSNFSFPKSILNCFDHLKL